MILCLLTRVANNSVLLKYYYFFFFTDRKKDKILSMKGFNLKHFFTKREFFVLTLSLVISILLASASFIFHAIKNQKNDYYSFYKDRIFYVSLDTKDNNESQYNNPFLYINATFYGDGVEPKTIALNRFYYLGGATSHLYYCFCNPAYSMCTFSIKDNLNVQWLSSSYFTKIDNFKMYKITLTSNGKYDTQNTGWMSPDLTVSQFADIFIGHHNSNIENYFFGINCYPNLVCSFGSLLDKEELTRCPKIGQVAGNNAFEQLETIKREFSEGL